jgi:hypothetical protein
MQTRRTVASGWVFCLGCLLLAWAAALPALAANPTIPQGTTRSFPSSGTDQPATGLTWDIVHNGSVIATSAPGQNNCWSVSLSGSTFTVSAPSSALIATNYEVRYLGGTGGGAAFQPNSVGGGSGISALFDVVAGNVALTLTLSAGGANANSSLTGLVALTSPAPTGGATVTLSSSNSSVASVPASVTIPAG